MHRMKSSTPPTLSMLEMVVLVRQLAHCVGKTSGSHLALLI
jgi:hypothetical protein